VPEERGAADLGAPGDLRPLLATFAMFDVADAPDAEPGAGIAALHPGRMREIPSPAESVSDGADGSSRG
jgi:hypothetical protein